LASFRVFLAAFFWAFFALVPTPEANFGASSVTVSRASEPASFSSENLEPRVEAAVDAAAEICFFARTRAFFADLVSFSASSLQA